MSGLWLYRPYWRLRADHPILLAGLVGTIRAGVAVRDEASDG
jgi:hypothetical protein